MNICFLCNEYPPGPHGGVGSFTQTLGRALAARGHRVSAVGLYPVTREVEEDDQGVRVFRLPFNITKAVGILIDKRRLVSQLEDLDRAARLDVLDGPELSFALLPEQLGRARVIRMNGGHHFFMRTLGREPYFWRGWLEKRSFAHASHWCAVSDFVGRTTRDLLRLNGQAIEILPNPVDTERFRPLPELPAKPNLIVFVGTVCEKKGVRQLVEAMPEIVAAVPDARLLVAGRDLRDPQTGASFVASLQAAIPPQLAAKIQFSGHVENAALPQLLARSSVCVFPSHMEAQGIVVIEGMAMGKAVVASQTGPGPELIEHGVSGLLCDPHDPHSIAHQVIAALTDHELRQRLGEEARQRALEKFSVATLVARNEAFYERCLKLS